MKAFICALSVLIILSCAVTINSIYVQNKTDELAEAIQSLPKEAENADIDEIRLQWDALEPIICYSVSHKETDQIGNALTELESHKNTGEAKEYHATRERLLELVRRLSESEGFSIKSIF